MTPDEKRILRVLYVAQKPLSTSKVAVNADMAWLTAKKYLYQLLEMELVNAGRKGKTVYWWLRVKSTL